MEHRWGERTALHLPVRVFAVDRTCESCLLRDASTSGAFIETTGRFSVLCPVEVELPDGTVAPAFVVRHTPRGVGVEWSEPVEAIERLLAGASPMKAMIRYGSTGTHVP